MSNSKFVIEDPYILVGGPPAPPLHSLETPFSIRPHKAILRTSPSETVSCEFTITAVHHSRRLNDAVHQCLKA